MRFAYIKGMLGILVPDGASVVLASSSRVKPHISLRGQQYKHCSCCRSWRPLGAFSFSSATSDNLQAFCKKCYSILSLKRKRDKFKATKTRV